MKSPPAIESNRPLQPHRTITPSDRFNQDQFYVPSYQEQKAIAAMSAGKKQEAIDWYDRAILDDPERGHRIFSQAVVYGYQPCQSAYSMFLLELNNIERMKANYRKGLLNVCLRTVGFSTDDYREAERRSDKLMQRVHLWDETPPQYSSNPATPVAPKQRKLKKQE
jgi:tetratricopeptide (TPR) repeat protein